MLNTVIVKGKYTSSAYRYGSEDLAKSGFERTKKKTAFKDCFISLVGNNKSLKGINNIFELGVN